MTPLTAAEKKILRELNREHGTKYKPDQLMEWSTSDVKAEKGEKVFFVTYYRVNVAIKL